MTIEAQNVCCIEAYFQKHMKFKGSKQQEYLSLTIIQRFNEVKKQ